MVADPEGDLLKFGWRSIFAYSCRSFYRYGRQEVDQNSFNGRKVCGDTISDFSHNGAASLSVTNQHTLFQNLQTWGQNHTKMPCREAVLMALSYYQYDPAFSTRLDKDVPFVPCEAQRLSRLQVYLRAKLESLRDMILHPSPSMDGVGDEDGPVLKLRPKSDAVPVDSAASPAPPAALSAQCQAILVWFTPEFIELVLDMVTIANTYQIPSKYTETTTTTNNQVAEVVAEVSSDGVAPQTKGLTAKSKLTTIYWMLDIIRATNFSITGGQILVNEVAFMLRYASLTLDQLAQIRYAHLQMLARAVPANIKLPKLSGDFLTAALATPKKKNSWDDEEVDDCDGSISAAPKGFFLTPSKFKLRPVAVHYILESTVASLAKMYAELVKLLTSKSGKIPTNASYLKNFCETKDFNRVVSAFSDKHQSAFSNRLRISSYPPSFTVIHPIQLPTEGSELDVSRPASDGVVCTVYPPPTTVDFGVTKAPTPSPASTTPVAAPERPRRNSSGSEVDEDDQPVQQPQPVNKIGSPTDNSPATTTIPNRTNKEQQKSDCSVM